MTVMRKSLPAVMLIVAGLSTASCSYLDKLTGGTDDTVLPGSREAAIPGKSQFPEASDTPVIEQPGGGQTAQTGTDATVAPAEPACKAGDANCPPASDGTFDDPQ